MKKINLQNILSEKLGDENLSVNDAIREAMKEACKQTLELAAENAKAFSYIDKFGNTEEAFINKQSILDINNQIE